MKLRILFVNTTVDFSVSDSARGYYRALQRQGHDVQLFNTMARLRFVAVALKNGSQPELHEDFRLVSRLASEGMVVEALRHQADLVIISCGLGLHPDGIEMLNRAEFPTALILTESPYDDEKQVVFSGHCGHVFTNDRHSARQHGWYYLPSAYDQEIHHPFFPRPADQCDVLFVGTGWRERQQLFEAVDWTGIHFKLLGLFPEMSEDSPIYPFYEATAVTNDETARLYCAAKICINHHRGSDVAESLSPRSYEIGACGAFQVSDWRPELAEVYGDSVPVYNTADELERIIRHTLERDCWTGGVPPLGQHLATEQRANLLAGAHTFDDRAAEMMSVITGQSPATWSRMS